MANQTVFSVTTQTRTLVNLVNPNFWKKQDLKSNLGIRNLLVILLSANGSRQATSHSSKALHKSLQSFLGGNARFPSLASHSVPDKNANPWGVFGFHPPPALALPTRSTGTGLESMLKVATWWHCCLRNVKYLLDRVSPSTLCGWKKHTGLTALLVYRALGCSWCIGMYWEKVLSLLLISRGAKVQLQGWDLCAPLVVSCPGWYSEAEPAFQGQYYPRKLPDSFSSSPGTIAWLLTSTSFGFVLWRWNSIPREDMVGRRLALA